MAKLNIDRNDSIEGEVVATHWDFKKIAAGFVVLSLLIIVGAYILFPSGGAESQQNTLGVSSEGGRDVPPLPDKEDIEDIIAGTKESLSQITSENLTSSQAAIQKIISDLEILKGNASAKGAICSLICKE